MRPQGIHPTAVIGEPPEHRDWHIGYPYFPPEISFSARVNAFATIDSGLKSPTRIGARSFVMTKAHVGHDVQIGDDCEIAPLVSIGGWVRIGNRVKVGQGAVFKPRVTVGDDAVIGCGAVVVSDVPAGEVWVGNPARCLRLAATGPVLTELEEQGWEEVAAETTTDWEEWWQHSRR